MIEVNSFWVKYCFRFDTTYIIPFSSKYQIHCISCIFSYPQKRDTFPVFMFLLYHIGWLKNSLYVVISVFYCIFYYFNMSFHNGFFKSFNNVLSYSKPKYRVLSRIIWCFNSCIHFQAFHKTIYVNRFHSPLFIGLCYLFSLNFINLNSTKS